MGNLDHKEFTRRHRPHFSPPNGTLFVTFRLAETIPKVLVRQHQQRLRWLESQIIRVERLAAADATNEILRWTEQIKATHREWFQKTEDILHRCEHGPTWLAQPALADKVAENLHRLDGDGYRLDAFSVMSNHVHTIFKPFITDTEFLTLIRWDGLATIEEHPALARMMHSLKGRSAYECNMLLGRKGAFWEHESFDHVIRKGKFDSTMRYVLNNPVKAGLVTNWQDWPWTYCRPELSDKL